MRRVIETATLLVLTVTGTSALAAPKPLEHVYGPPPAWEDYRTLAEAELRSRLLDLESGRITWDGGFYKGEFKMFFRGRTAGYVACGTINAKNRMGGYVGAVAFATVIDYGRVLFAEMDEPSGVEIMNRCAQARSGGLIPPLPPTEGTAGREPNGDPASSASNAAGLSLRAMPEGAYVSAIALGSAAEAAGLRAGLVITAVNGIPLAGMGKAMLKIIEVAGPAASLTVVGGATFKLGAKP